MIAKGAVNASDLNERRSGAGGPGTAESGRVEDVVPSRMRGSEEVGPPDDPNPTPADESQMDISEMAVILMSLGVAPASFKMAESFCRNRFGESAVNMGLERGLVVHSATSWSMSDEEQMKEVEPPMCRAFSTSVELTQASKPSEFELKSLVERCVTHLKFCFKMYETQRNAGRLFLHEHPWDAWSRGLTFVNDMAEKDDAQDEKRLVSISFGNEQCRERIMVHVELRVHHRGVQQALLQQRWQGQESHEELFGC